MSALEERNLALATIQVIQMWSNPRYESFLLHSQPGVINEEWFRWFVGSWNVARTIGDGFQGDVRDYLDSELRSVLMNSGGAEAIDAAARHIQQRRWSSRSGRTRDYSLPVSLVSKIAFFLRPSKFVPLDRYAVKGLNLARRRAGERRLKGKSYSEYFAAFNDFYAEVDSQLEFALRQCWVAELAGRLGCPAKALPTVAMRRKLLDDYLMHYGEYQK